MATDPVQGAGGLNAATRAALEKLKGQIDSNTNGLKGSELINFQQFAQANGISDADIQAFMAENGLAVTKSAKDIRKEDIADFKDAEYSRTSRGTKNEIIEQRQGYMQVALDALKNAKTPEEKAAIMDLVQSMPRSADSVGRFKTDMQIWRGRLENVIGHERTEQSMAAFSKKTGESFAQVGRTLEQTEAAIKGAITEAKDEIKENDDANAAAINQHTTAEAGATRKHVSNVGNNVVRRVNAHTSAEAAETRTHVTEEADRVIEEVNAHTDEVGEKVTRDVNAHTDQVAKGLSKDINEAANRATAATQEKAEELAAGQEITRMMQKTHGIFTSDTDIQALGNEATDIIQDRRLSHNQKMLLLQSITDMLNNEAWVSDANLADVRHARALAQRGVDLPTVERDLNGVTRKYIDYDRLPDLPTN